MVLKMIEISFKEEEGKGDSLIFPPSIRFAKLDPAVDLDVKNTLSRLTDIEQPDLKT